MGRSPPYEKYHHNILNDPAYDKSTTVSYVQEDVQLAIIGRDVIYTRNGGRKGWKGHVTACCGRRVTIKWDNSTEPTQYIVNSMFNAEYAYLELQDNIMAHYTHNPSVRGKKFFMVVDHTGDVQSGMITEDEAYTIAEEFAADSKQKHPYFVVSAAGKCQAERPPITRSAL